MDITAHTLVRNEENFVWYAIQSVLPHVDQIIVWDTGSTDNTVEIIKTINSRKIKFEQKGYVDTKGVGVLRQQMLEETKSKWIMILDGDEIWWDNAIENCRLKILNSHYDLVVSPVYMLIGDIFHFQDKKAGRYKIGKKRGHYNIRFIKNSPNLYVQGIYPNEAYMVDGVKLQDFPEEKIYFSPDHYLHASHLKRSHLQNSKYKLEIGHEFPRDFYYPESFFLPRPSIVPSQWEPMKSKEKFIARVQTPLKKIKRYVYA
jgi:glycosyltransferase involved in cell wall biosynthesis